MNQHKGFCFRCEYRARVLENRIPAHAGPRAQCGDINASVYSCYLYKPVAPLIFKPEKGDKRPLSLNLLSCRINPVEVAEGEYLLKKVRNGKKMKGYIAVFIPRGTDLYDLLNGKNKG